MPSWYFLIPWEEYSTFWCKEKEKKSLKSTEINVRQKAFYGNTD